MGAQQDQDPFVDKAPSRIIFNENPNADRKQTKLGVHSLEDIGSLTSRVIEKENPTKTISKL